VREQPHGTEDERCDCVGGVRSAGLVGTPFGARRSDELQLLAVHGVDPVKLDAQAAALAGLAALAKTVGREWPDAGAKAIDVQGGADGAEIVADRVARELLGGGPEVEVGFRDNGRRITIELVPRIASEGKFPIDSRSVVIATGGARGVTAAALLALATQTKARFVLLGRTALTDENADLRDARDEAALMRVLAARGNGRAGDARALRADARRTLAMREVRDTLLHEVGHLNGEDDDQLRERGL